MLLLEIAKHELNPGQLFKIDLQLKDQPKDSQSIQLSEAGILIKAEEGHLPQKEYLSFRSLHDSLHIYFNVLMHQLIASGNQASLIDFAHSSSKYIFRPVRSSTLSMSGPRCWNITSNSTTGT